MRKKLTPFPEPKELLMVELSRLNRDDPARFIWRTVGPAWTVYTSFYILTHSLSCLSVPFQK